MWIMWTEKHYTYFRDYGSYKEVHGQEKEDYELIIYLVGHN